MAYNQERKKIIKVRGAKLMYRPNFSGDPMKNYDGKSRQKNFTVILEDEKETKDPTKMMYRYDGKPLKIDDLLKDGWYLKTKEYEDEPPETFIAVKINYDERHSPSIYRGTNPDNMRKLNDSTIGVLDDDYILNIDLDITPSSWSSKNDGVYDRKSGYVRSMYVLVEEDELEEKYGTFVDDDEMMTSGNDLEDAPF